MRVACIVMAVVFVVFAALQYNDPDLLVWVALYGFAAAVSLLAASARQGWAPVAGLLIYASGFFMLAPTIDAGWWHSEEAREGLGLLVATLWMGALLVPTVRSRRAAGASAAS